MHRFLTTLFLAAFGTILLQAQNWNQILSKEIEAEYFLLEKCYEKAALKYLEALDLYPQNANMLYKIGYSYLLTPDKKEYAIKYLEQAAEKVSLDYNPKAIKEANAPPEALFYLGKAYQITNQFKRAEDVYRRYREHLDPLEDFCRYVDLLVAQCKNAPALMEEKKGLKAKNLGTSINDSDMNFNAVFSGDGKTMAFTRCNESGYEVLVARNLGESWGDPVSISEEIRAYFLKTSGISYDGTELYLIDDFTSEGIVYYFPYEKGSVYYTYYDNGKWAKVQKLKKPINSKYNESHASISPDGHTLYFASDRPGGYGGLDIYKSTIDSKGKWSQPENLGPTINSEFNENTPFLSSDGRYLFFSSEAHNSMGGYDIFYADLTVGTQPVRMGFPLNNAEDNLFFFPNDLTSGYMAYHDPKGHGHKDIFYTKLLPYVNLMGNITITNDGGTNLSPDFNVSLYSIDENMSETPLDVDRHSRSFAHTLLPGNYHVSVKGDGFNDFDQTINISEDYDLTNFPLEIAMIPIVQQVAVAEVQQELPDEVEVALPVLNQPVSDDKHHEAMGKKRDVEKPSPKRDVAVMPKIVFDNSSSASESAFTVQILALIVPVGLDFFQDIEGVSVVKGSDGFHRYTVGSFTTREEALNSRQQLVALGYKDAFVRKAIAPAAAAARFAIQVMALKNPVEVNFFSNLDNVRVSHGDDGFYRYFYGTYQSLEEAKHELPRIKELGYSDAFVRKLE